MMLFSLGDIHEFSPERSDSLGITLKMPHNKFENLLFADRIIDIGSFFSFDYPDLMCGAHAFLEEGEDFCIDRRDLFAVLFEVGHTC
jgi:hypothetical protein